MKKMFLLAALAMVLTACQNTPQQPADLLAGEWNFETVEGEPVVESEEEAFLGLNVEDSTIFGCTGCNLLTGRFRFDTETQTISFDGMGMTHMLCEDMMTEQQVVAALFATTCYSVDANRLTLSNGEGEVATLIRR